MFDLLINLFITIINAILKLIFFIIDGILGFIFSVFPPSPEILISINSDVETFLSFVNVFIPVKTCIAIAEAWLLAITVYYVYSFIAKFFKVLT